MKRPSKFFLAVLLLTVPSVGWAAQTIDQWGAAHYQNYGKAEGRTLPGNGNYGDYVRQYPDLLSVYNATSSGGGGTTSSGCYGDYVRQYSDLLSVYNTSGGGQLIEDWGKSHYDTWGKGEGRTLPASCGGTGGTTTTTTATEACYGDYVRAYPDLLVAYNASGGGQSIEAWGKTHYQGSGQVEGRSACTPRGDYQYLYDHNANLLGGRTTRWESTTIQVSGAVGSWREAVDRWSAVTNVNLVHVNSTPADGLGFEIVGYVALDDACGRASRSYWSSSGTWASCKIKIHPDVKKLGCIEDWTMTHEVGHCLGFRGHSDDNGIMRAGSWGGTGTITDKTRAFINLLYSLPPGTDINSKL